MPTTRSSMPGSEGSGGGWRSEQYTEEPGDMTGTPKAGSRSTTSIGEQQAPESRPLPAPPSSPPLSSFLPNLTSSFSSFNLSSLIPKIATTKISFSLLNVTDDDPTHPHNGMGRSGSANLGPEEAEEEFERGEIVGAGIGEEEGVEYGGRRGARRSKRERWSMDLRLEDGESLVLLPQTKGGGPSPRISCFYRKPRARRYPLSLSLPLAVVLARV
jgi:hypothetical protein